MIRYYTNFHYLFLSVICEKANQYSKACLLIVIIFVVLLALALQYVPHWQVAQKCLEFFIFNFHTNY